MIMYLGQFRHSLLRMKLGTIRANATRNTIVVINISRLRSLCSLEFNLALTLD